MNLTNTLVDTPGSGLQQNGEGAVAVRCYMMTSLAPGLVKVSGSSFFFLNLFIFH